MAFSLIEVTIEGSRPMLQHRATEEALSGSTRNNNPIEKENPRDICERTVYRLTGGQLAIPGAALARLVREAGGSHKAKGSRKSLKYLVPAAVLIMDDLVGLTLHNDEPLTDFEVDSRPVTIPATKGRVMRHRARFNEWRATFAIRIDESVLDASTVRQLFVEGLQRIGLGDYRPEKGGPFGTSSIISWETLHEVASTPARRRNGKQPVEAPSLQAAE